MYGWLFISADKANCRGMPFSDLYSAWKLSLAISLLYAGLCPFCLFLDKLFYIYETSDISTMLWYPFLPSFWLVYSRSVGTGGFWACCVRLFNRAQEVATGAFSTFLPAQRRYGQQQILVAFVPGRAFQFSSAIRPLRSQTGLFCSCLPNSCGGCLALIGCLCPLLLRQIPGLCRPRLDSGLNCTGFFTQFLPSRLTLPL
jgi:hypothetical protein